MNYDLTHQRRGGRCAWCWEAIASTDSHTCVRAVSSPPLELRFHHPCWAVYRGLSGIEGAQMQALYREWTPQRVETLRLHAGLTLAQLAAKLHISRERLTAYLSGQVPRLGQKVLARLRGLAVDTRFERQEQGGGTVDWSDRRAVFCLCMHCQWTAGDMARRVGVRYASITAWWDRGCPKMSVRHWARLSQVAKKHHFDAGMLIDDRLWTAELARAAVEGAGLTRAAFAAAAGCHECLVRDACQGKRRINRTMAYYLTRGAVQLGLALPPAGRIAPKGRTPRPFPGGFKGPQGKQLWKPHELEVLGTMPDKACAAALPGRAVHSVGAMRKKLGIPKVSRVGWDGKTKTCPVPREEVLLRYYGRLGMPVPKD